MSGDWPERALDAPFTHPTEWPEPIAGTCSRCRKPALLGERRWWHDGVPACRDNGHQAYFLPDPPSLSKDQR